MPPISPEQINFNSDLIGEPLLHVTAYYQHITDYSNLNLVSTAAIIDGAPRLATDIGQYYVPARSVAHHTTSFTDDSQFAYAKRIKYYQTLPLYLRLELTDFVDVPVAMRQFTATNAEKKVQAELLVATAPSIELVLESLNNHERLDLRRLGKLAAGAYSESQSKAK